MKKILSFIFICFTVAGCLCDKTEQPAVYNRPFQPYIFKSDFNQEHYIWENWIFPDFNTDNK